VNTSQWDVIMLKDEKCNTALDQICTYFKTCVNLIYLTLDNAGLICLNLTPLEKLEVLFLGYGANGRSSFQHEDIRFVYLKGKISGT
jgi:hypothetical protein